MGAEEGTLLERELTELLEVERFAPPSEFAAKALLADPAVYEEAAADPEAWWLRQAKELLDWDSEPSEALDESNPPFFKWFADGELNVSANCLDRHVAAGLGDRVAYHWRGEEGEERDLTYAELLADTQRFANALRDHGVRQGRRGRDLPADDPPGRRRDARLRADRRRPQRRLRRLLGRGGARADGVLRGEGADHRRRGAPQGQDGAGQGPGRRGDGRGRLDRDDLRRQAQRRGVRDAGGPRRLVRGGDGGRRRRVPGRADERRGPALHPLHLGLDREAEGHPAHDRRLPDRRRLHPPLRLRPEAGGGRLLVRGRRRLGHRPLLHRLRAARQRGDQRDVRGRARLPRQGHLVGADRALRGDDPLHRADGDPRLHEMGRRVPGAPRPLARCGCSARSASRSTRRPGSGTTRSSAASAARSSTPGGRRRPATS